MSRKLLTVFLDGLKPESLQYMPFLNSFNYKVRLKTQLGYSVTCHANMYTGVYPDVHKLLFVWKKSPKTSPFKLTKFLKYIPFINCLPSKLILHKILSRFKKNTSFFKIPRIVHLPVKYWNLLDVSEYKLWTEDGYLETVPTIFEILKKNHVDFEIIGMDQSEKNESLIVERYKFKEIKQWTYLFMGDVDHFSHTFGQTSPEGIKRLKELDALIAKKYKEYSEKVANFDFILFSDHGHIKVTEKIDVYKIFKEEGIDLNKYFHIIDVNYLRIWVNENDEIKKLENILINKLKGFVLTDDKLKEFKWPIDRYSYGDIIFYLDEPYVFSKTIWGYSRNMNSMHGYSPEHHDSDGIFVSNLKIKKEIIDLVDILPSHLELLNIDIPEYVKGISVWK